MHMPPQGNTGPAHTNGTDRGEEMPGSNPTRTPSKTLARYSAREIAWQILENCAIETSDQSLNRNIIGQRLW